MTARPVLIVGAGGFAREAAEAVRAVQAHDGSVELLGFVDDDPAQWGRQLVGASVVGPVEEVAHYGDVGVVVAIGRPDTYASRREVVARLGLEEHRFATVVHPAATVGSTCRLGPGTVVLAHVTMTADVTVGRHVVVMPQVVLTHDVHVADHATLASGVRLGGGVRVGTGAYVASGVLVREGCRIGPWSLVGMGSVVTTDVPAERVWFGSPARDVRRAPLPWGAVDAADIVPAPVLALDPQPVPENSLSPPREGDPVSTIPLVDLSAQHTQIAEEVQDGFEEVLATGDFIGGKAVTAFEQEYAEFVGARHCVGVANGTDALEMALRAVGVGHDDEVIVPASTFIATAEAVVRSGARPVFVDVDPDTLLLDVARVERSLSSRTRAVVPVDLYGQVAPYDELASVLGERSIAVVEDGAQSQGATRLGRSAGTFGRVAATSFYPGKNLGAYGDAGAVVTDDDDLAHQVRLLGAHGSPAKYVHDRFGFNSRLDTLQAVVLRAKLRRLPHWNEQRREAAARYDRLLADVPEVRVPVTLAGNVHVWHLYVVRAPRRDDVLRFLQAEGVGAGVHYPVPVHLTPAMSGSGHTVGDFPVSERAAEEILSLPLFPGITATQQERVVDALLRALGSTTV